MNVRIILVVVSLCLSIFIGLRLSSGNQAQAPASGKDEIIIGLSMDTQKEARWQKDRDIFRAQAEKLGAKVLIQSANSDDTRQIQDVKSLITNNVDVLVIIPHNGEAMAKAVELAHEAKIPVLAYDRLITNSDLDLYITFDNVKVGELQAKYLVENLPTPGKGKIVRIYGAKTDNNAFLFKKGQDNILNPLIEKGDIEVIHEDWAENWNPENAKKIMNAAMTKHGTNFDAILASNDGTAGGAIQTLKENGIAGKILVTGQDADLAACQRIASGTQSMTIYKPIQNLATEAANIAYGMATKKIVVAKSTVNNKTKDVPSVLLEVKAVNKDNLNSTIVADGFHTKEAIYGK